MKFCTEAHIVPQQAYSDVQVVAEAAFSMVTAAPSDADGSAFDRMEDSQASLESPLVYAAHNGRCVCRRLFTVRLCVRQSDNTLLMCPCLCVARCGAHGPLTFVRCSRCRPSMSFGQFVAGLLVLAHGVLGNARDERKMYFAMMVNQYVAPMAPGSLLERLPHDTSPLASIALAKQSLRSLKRHLSSPVSPLSAMPPTPPSAVDSFRVGAVPYRGSGAAPPGGFAYGGSVDAPEPTPRTRSRSPGSVGASTAGDRRSGVSSVVATQLRSTNKSDRAAWMSSQAKSEGPMELVRLSPEHRFSGANGPAAASDTRFSMDLPDVRDVFEKDQRALKVTCDATAAGFSVVGVGVYYVLLVAECPVSVCR